MTRYILLFLTIFCLTESFAQSNEKQAFVLPYYNFKKGIGITSPDSIYQMNIRFRMQNRATYLHQENLDEDIIQGEVRRLRLRFDGFIGSPEFLYTLQLSFSPGDTGAIQSSENLQVIRDAMIYYSPSKNWLFGFGQTKLPGNRQRLNSSGALQLTDRSINNANFNIDRDFGIQIYNLNEHPDKFSYNIKTAISNGEGRNTAKNKDNGLAYTGKVEFFPLGAFSNNGSFFEGDLARESNPKLMISGAYSYNHKASRSQGQQGSELYEKRNLSSFFLDAMLKYRGWAFQSSYMNRYTPDPITTNSQGDTNFVYAGSGMDFQLSYLFKSDYDIIGRYSFQNMQDELRTFAPDKRQYSIGLTKYIWEHAFKLQAEFTYDQLSHANGQTNDNWYIRFQVEIGI